jgi:hypothetical protein
VATSGAGVATSGAGVATSGAGVATSEVDVAAGEVDVVGCIISSFIGLLGISTTLLPAPAGMVVCSIVLEGQYVEYPAMD